MDNFTFQQQFQGNTAGAANETENLDPLVRMSTPNAPSPTNAPGTELPTHIGLREPKLARLSDRLRRRRLLGSIDADGLSAASDSDFDPMEIDRRRASTPKIDALRQQGQGPAPLSPAPSPTPVVRPFAGSANSEESQRSRSRQRIGSSFERSWSPAPGARPQSPRPRQSSLYKEHTLNDRYDSGARAGEGYGMSGLGLRDGEPAAMSIATQAYACMNDEQRTALLLQLLDQSGREVLLAARNYVEPKLRHDPFKYLPGEISLRIISYLDTPASLAAASQVSRRWYLLLSDDSTWKRLCTTHHYRRISAAGTEVPSRANLPNDNAVAFSLGNLSEMQYDPTATESDTPTSYRSLFRQQYLLRSAWESGGRLAAHYKFDFVPNVIVTAFVMNQDYIVMSMDNSRILVFSSAGRLLSSLYGHVMGVWALALNGHTLVSGGCDRGVRVWDLRTGLCTQILKGHASTIRCLEMASEDIAVSSSRDATIRIWNVKTGECLRILEGHTSTVRRIWADASRNVIVSASYDCTARVWNMETGEQMHCLQGHLGQIYSLAVEGNTIATGSLDMSIRVWDMQTGACTGVLQGHLALVGQLCLRGNTLVSGASDSAIRIWDLTTMQCRLRIAAHDNSVTCLQYDGERIVSGGPDGQIHIWHAQTGKQLRTLGYRLSTVWGVAALNDRLAFVGVQGTSTVVDLLSFVPEPGVDSPALSAQPDDSEIRSRPLDIDADADEEISESAESSGYDSDASEQSMAPSGSERSLSSTFGPALIRPSSRWQDVASRNA